MVLLGVGFFFIMFLFGFGSHPTKDAERNCSHSGEQGSFSLQSKTERRGEEIVRVTKERKDPREGKKERVTHFPFSLERRKINGWKGKLKAVGGCWRIPR